MGSEFSSLIETLSHTLQKEHELGKVVTKTRKEIFKDMTNPNEIKNHVNEYFSSIYILEVEPREIEKYRPYSYIYETLTKYEIRGEMRPISLMFLKHKEEYRAQAKELFETMKRKHPDIPLVLQDTSHYLVVGAFGGSTPRANSEIINIIKNNLEHYQL